MSTPWRRVVRKTHQPLVFQSPVNTTREEATWISVLYRLSSVNHIEIFSTLHRATRLKLNTHEPVSAANAASYVYK